MHPVHPVLFSRERAAERDLSLPAAIDGDGARQAEPKLFGQGADHSGGFRDATLLGGTSVGQRECISMQVPVGQAIQLRENHAVIRCIQSLRGEGALQPRPKDFRNRIVESQE